MRGYRDDYLSYLAVYRVESWKVYYNNSSLVRFRMLSSNHILSESYKHVTKQEQEWCKVIIMASFPFPLLALALPVAYSEPSTPPSNLETSSTSCKKVNC
jgi:hypothetical protein